MKSVYLSMFCCLALGLPDLFQVQFAYSSDSKAGPEADAPPRHRGVGEAGAVGSKNSMESARSAKVVEQQIREYLKNIIYTPERIEKWLLGEGMKDIHDAKMGWVHHTGTWADGIGGAISTYNYDDTGARRMVAYADQPCRINTYGNSFTHCDQVSDGESWQEVLATHLCEPIRNYGLSGHSVYQMYLRMLQEEEKNPAEYIIMNIYSDDHYRSVYGWAGIPTGVHDIEIIRGAQKRPPMPWVDVNPKTHMFIEHENLCSTPELLHKMTDLEWVLENFRDSLVLRVYLARKNIRLGTPEKSYDDIRALAKEHGVEADIDSPEELGEVAQRVYDAASFFASERIVEMVEEFAAKNNKKVLYVLSYTMYDLAAYLNGEGRVDKVFVDFLDEKGLPYVDTLKAHGEDCAQFKISVDDYMDRYYIGHYNPLGNVFQAFAIIKPLVDMLEPKPVTYRR